MAFGDPYASLIELKDYAKIRATDKDDTLTDALESASREINDHCHRQFNRSDDATARDYHVTEPWEVEVDDFYSTDGLIIALDNDYSGSFDTTLAATDYELYPLNGVVDGTPGWPFSSFATVGGLCLPRPYYSRRRATVRVTAKWGWAEVPAPIKRSCLMMAAWMWKLAESPTGVAGMDQFGAVRIRDIPGIEKRLFPYIRDPILVG